MPLGCSDDREFADECIVAVATIDVVVVRSLARYEQVAAVACAVIDRHAFGIVGEVATFDGVHGGAL